MTKKEIKGKVFALDFKSHAKTFCFVHDLAWVSSEKSSWLKHKRISTAAADSEDHVCLFLLFTIVHMNTSENFFDLLQK